jgi:hypothetical protein
VLAIEIHQVDLAVVISGDGMILERDHAAVR